MVRVGVLAHPVGGRQMCFPLFVMFIGLPDPPSTEGRLGGPTTTTTREPHSVGAAYLESLVPFLDKQDLPFVAGWTSSGGETS